MISLIFFYKDWFVIYSYRFENDIYIYIKEISKKRTKQIFHNILVLAVKTLVQECYEILYLKICNSSENVSTRML